MADPPGGGKGGRGERPLLRAEVVEHHQRERILDGAAKVISRKGYREVSVADIVSSAAIARASFYANFGSKEDCFFALYDRSAAEALQITAAACEAAEGEFPARVRAGLGALLAAIEADRDVARSLVIGGPAAGPAIGQRFESLIADFADLLRRGRDLHSGAELPESAEETVVGGLYWLLYYALLEDEAKLTADLLPQLAEFSLIPFVGAEAARSPIT